MALRLTLKRNCGVDARRLAELSALVARASGRPLPPDKPVTGAGVFRHESGIHVRGLLADRRTYEPFAPRTVGHADTEIVLGKHSGGAAIRQVLAEKGIRIQRRGGDLPGGGRAGCRGAGKRRRFLHRTTSRPSFHYHLIGRFPMKVELVGVAKPESVAFENLPAVLGRDGPADRERGDSPPGNCHCLIGPDR